MTTDGLLLDTCAIYYIAEGMQLSRSVMSSIDESSEQGQLFLSPISAWEIGRTVASGRTALTTEPLRFFLQFKERSFAKLCELGPDILVGSSFLPGEIHKDPFDRILIETARRLQLRLVTSDRAIIAYGSAGHVKILAC